MTLKKWVDIKGDFTDALLLGNGFSIEFHKGFEYSNLWESAKYEGFIGDEIDELAGIFSIAPNFEHLLRKLYTAEVVNKHLNINEVLIQEAYEKLRKALIETVRKVHCKHNDISERLEEPIPFLKNFKTIFSLNYDLLIYWMILIDINNKTGHPFRDCFNKNRFEYNWEIYRTPYDYETNRTLVFYPHGALHLMQTKEEIDEKIIAEGSTLLETIIGQWNKDTCLPLFVSEGNSEKKMQFIRRSKYLSTIYHEILPKSGPTLVIMGWSMDIKVDAHILKQIGKGNYEKIAIAVHRKTQKGIETFIDET
ncbi:MAG: DUF4917 family protein, partial [Kordiimonadaceae bacterium]|nr:DUF4917 family protein [Kordiimonadaceae bacterium]